MSARQGTKVQRAEPRYKGGAEGDAERALQIATDIGAKGKEGIGHRVLGMVYREQERWEDAVDEFKRGIYILEEYGERVESSEIHYEYGLMWKAKGRQEKAKEHLEKALSMLEDMGMKLWSEKSEETLMAIEVD
ncbi:MAG: tetratricopeptide repeat protein [Candidatus Thermoplasmatota archaeon]